MFHTHAGAFSRSIADRHCSDAGVPSDLSTGAPYPASAARGLIELIWGNLEEPHDRHGEEEQLGQTVTTVELLLYGEVIID